MDKLVNIRSFFNNMEFEMAKSYLESCGIECFARDEMTNRTYVNNVNGGVKLDVREEQAEEAIKLLKEKGYIKDEDFEPNPAMKWLTKILNKFIKRR